MSSRFLVTGLSSYLGQWLQKTDLFKGHSLVRIIRPGTKILKTDIEYPGPSFEEQVQAAAPDVVLHLATNYGRDPKTVGQIASVNFDLPYRIFQALAGRKDVVFVNCDTKLPRNISDYAFFKGAFTEIAERLVNSQKGPRLLTLKLEHFYGPDGPAHHFVSSVAGKLRRNEDIPLSPGTQTRDFVHIQDAAEAFAFAVKKFSASPHPVLNVEIGSGEQIQIKTLVEKMKAISGAGSELLFGAIPMRPNEVMASVADLSQLHSWGWQPKISLEQGLRQLFANEGEF